MMDIPMMETLTVTKRRMYQTTDSSLLEPPQWKASKSTTLWRLWFKSKHVISERSTYWCLYSPRRSCTSLNGNSWRHFHSYKQSAVFELTCQHVGTGWLSTCYPSSPEALGLMPLQFWEVLVVSFYRCLKTSNGYKERSQKLEDRYYQVPNAAKCLRDLPEIPVWGLGLDCLRVRDGLVACPWTLKMGCSECYSRQDRVVLGKQCWTT